MDEWQPAILDNPGHARHRYRWEPKTKPQKGVSIKGQIVRVRETQPTDLIVACNGRLLEVHPEDVRRLQIIAPGEEGVHFCICEHGIITD